MSLNSMAKRKQHTRTTTEKYRILGERRNVYCNLANMEFQNTWCLDGQYDKIDKSRTRMRSAASKDLDKFC